MLITGSATCSSHIVLCIVALLHISFSVWFARHTFFPDGAAQGNTVVHTYIGEDYPLKHPIGHLDTVAMTLHESVHYDLNGTDEIARYEWLRLVSHPKEMGRTRLGPDHRLFVMTFHHQIHCLYQFQLALTMPGLPMPHLHHCFNYLRQTFLCTGADMLEKGDFMQREFGRDRLGDDLICEDWSRVYDELDKNYEEWVEWSAKWN